MNEKDSDTFQKWIHFLADKSKVTIDNVNDHVYYEGELIEDIKLPHLKLDDLKIYNGIDLQAEMHHTVLSELVDRFKLSETERRMAQAELVLNWRIKRK